MKKDKQAKNLVKNENRKFQDRSSLQMVQKSKSKNSEPKRSAFASGLSNNKLMSSHGNGKFGAKQYRDYLK